MIDPPANPIGTAAFAARIDLLRDSLSMGETSEDLRAPIRDELLALSHDLDAAIVELESLKESLRPLAELYKERFPRPKAAHVDRVDHLGSATFRERGWSSIAAGEYEEAIVHLQKSIELDGANTGAKVLLAWAYLRSGSQDLAGVLLENVLTADPTDPLARTTLGYLQIMRGEFGDAIRNLAEVTKSSGDRTAVIYATLYMGVAYGRRAMERDAQEFLRRAIELSPNLTEGYWELGWSHEREGRRELALESWRAGAENRFNSWGDRCRAALNQMEAERASGP